MKKALLTAMFISVLLTLQGCAAKSLQGGGINKNVRDYEGLSTYKNTKNVSYFCNFDRIARGDASTFGEYCIQPDNLDYVSYFMSYDVQASNIYKNHLIQMTDMVSKGNAAGSLKYYQLYSGGNYNKLLTHDISPLFPGTFAALSGNNTYHIAIPREDLLARVKIYPELTIKSIQQAPGTNGQHISDYLAVYQITPYMFSLSYSDTEIGRVLGLPGYVNLAGRMTDAQKQQLEAYNTQLSEYWKNPNQTVYDNSKINIMDYAIPQLGTEKFRDSVLGSDLALRVTPPARGENLVNAYLPSYDLQTIQIILVTRDERETVLKTFNNDDIMKALISYDDVSMLYYKDNLPEEGDIVIRYIHTASEPESQGLKRNTAEAVGLGYIYSDIAYTIHTNIHITRYYTLENLPAACLNQEAYFKAFENRGLNRQEAESLLRRLDQSPLTTCSSVQTSMGQILPYIDIY